MNHYKISIIIVNYNTDPLLTNCIRSIHKNKYFDESPPGIYVVDNASTDNSIQNLKKEFPSVIIIENKENKGFAYANNQALRIIDTPYILLLNTDTLVDRLNVHLLVSHLKNQKKIGMTGPALTYKNGRHQASAYTFSTPLRVFCELIYLTNLLSPLLSTIKIKGINEVDYLQGSVLLIKKEFLDNVGLFDEDFFFYHEEMELAYRGHKKGWKCLYEPFTSAVHFCAGTSGGLDEKKMIWYYEQLLKYYKKHFPGKMRRVKTAIKSGIYIRSAVNHPGRLFRFGSEKKFKNETSACKHILSIL